MSVLSPASGLSRGIAAAGSAAQLYRIFTDAQRFFWGVVDSETLNPIVTISSVIGIDFSSGSSVVSAAIEQGSFASFNKVSEPETINLTCAFEGEDDYLQGVLGAIRGLKTGTRRVNIVTPYYEFQNYTLESFNYNQSQSNGLGVLYFDMTFVEIKEVETMYVGKNVITQKAAKNPSDVSARDMGKVNGQEESWLQKGAKLFS